jgi:hypothetical protein
MELEGGGRRRIETAGHKNNEIIDRGGEVSVDD